MIVTPNLKFWLPMEGNANDASGNGNNGTVSGAVLATGKFGQCYNFDGTNDYITISPNTSLNVGNILTISAWFKTDSISKRQTIYSHGSNASGGMQLEINGQGSGSFGMIMNGIWLYYTGVNKFSAGEWNNIAYTRSGAGGGNHKLYLNGTEITDIVRQTSDNFTDQTANSLIAGRTTSTQLFDGEIDNVLIFSKVLSQSDIKRVMMGLHPLSG